MLFAVSLYPLPSSAALVCDRVEATCTDAAPRTASTGWPISAPAIYNGTGCWSWANTYRCLDSNPTYSCTGGGGNAMADCALVGGSINSTTTIKGIAWVTGASYNYACEFPPLKEPAQPPLPPFKTCVLLETRVNYINPVAADRAQTASDEYIIGSRRFSPPGDTIAPATVPPAGGNPPVLAPLSEVISMTREVKTEFVCYDKPIETCVDTCYGTGTAVGATGSGRPPPGTPNVEPIACPTPLLKAACTLQTDLCDGTRNSAVVDSGRLEQGPDGRCIKSTAIYYCPVDTAPACINNPNCSLVDSRWETTAPNGLPITMEQTYECSTTETECERVGSVNSCTTLQAWGMDDMGIETTVGDGMAQANTAMSKIEGIQKGMSEEDIFIFSGQDLRCRYPVGTFLNSLITIAFSLALTAMTGGTLLGMMLGLSNTTALALGAALSLAQDIPNSKAFGTDCCKDYIIEGSDAWWKIGSCSADEVKLAVARSKQLTVKIGDDYCSKRTGFPIRECKEKTKTYCVFDDMLALTVNEQGRMQLDRLASESSANTLTSSDMYVAMFDAQVFPDPGHAYKGMDTGAWWKIATFNGTDLYSWRYPYYCSSTSAQSGAYAAYVREVNQAVDMTAFIPAKDRDGKYILTNLTPAEKIRIAAKLQTIPNFQECASLPGVMTFMACGTGTGCDLAKMPASPNGIEYDELGEVIGGEQDPSWRIQQVRSFYEPGDYGVSGRMPSNSSYAKVSNALTENVTANGSCKEYSGSCLYNFAVTLGRARHRIQEKVRFPLYSLSASAEYPTIEYMPMDGSLPLAAYMADSNRGLGTPVDVSKQRYIFHPILQTQAPAHGMHPAILLEWAYIKREAGKPQGDYVPLALPTDLMAETPGWWPKMSSDGQAAFYISGGCDPDSKWCEYIIQQDLVIERHPWGTNKAPRCWGFSLDQMTVLDFGAMDLSRWINSLDFDGMASSIPAAAQTAMAGQVTASAQTFYSAMSTGTEMTTTTAEQQVLVLSNDTLPDFKSLPYEAYKLDVAIPSNWPKYYRTGEGTNDNPVLSATADFGRADADTTTPLRKSDDGKSFSVYADLGGYPVGTYKVTVKVNTARSGQQVLSQYVRVTPYYGNAPRDTTLDFANSNINAAPAETVNPSALRDGGHQTSQGVRNADGTTVPGLSKLYQTQGGQVSPARVGD